MDWEKNRLWIGLGLLVVLVGAGIWTYRTRRGDTPATEQTTPSAFPDISEDDVSSLEITRPASDGEGEPETVRLNRGEGGWTLSVPVEARADQGAIDTALDKLDELEVVGIAASRSQFHERLEVDDAHGIHVVARNGDEVIADLIIGAYRSGNTMVRVAGQDQVVMVRGSIRFAFSKDLKDWRDRGVLALEADDVREVAFVGPNGSFRFTRPTETVTPEPPAEGEEAEGEGETPEPTTRLGEWQIAEVSYTRPASYPDGGVIPPDAGVVADAVPATPMTTIEGFQASRLRSIISSLARMRASDFAAADVTAAQAGLGDGAARVTLTVGEGSAAQTYTVRLGNEASSERHDYYAQREGDDTIFIISRFLSERINPSYSSFLAPAASATAEPEGGGEGEGGADPHGGMMGGGGGGSIPPEVMDQIRRQLEQQGAGGGM